MAAPSIWIFALTTPPSEFDPSFAAVKRVMLERAQQRLLLVDHRKFGRTMLDLVCPLAELAEIVVDLPPTSPLLAALQQASVNVQEAAGDTT